MDSTKNNSDSERLPEGTGEIFRGIQQVMTLYHQYATSRTTTDPIGLLVDFFEGDNGVVTICQRLRYITPTQAKALGAYTLAGGTLIVLADGYASETLALTLRNLMVFLVSCHADDMICGVFTNQLTQLYQSLLHLLGNTNDPDLLIEIQAVTRAIDLQLRIPCPEIITGSQ